MTADYYPFEHSFLARTATRIVNEVRGINRVVYDVTSASRPGRLSGSRRRVHLKYNGLRTPKKFAERCRFPTSSFVVPMRGQRGRL